MPTAAEWWAGGQRLPEGCFTRADGPVDAPVVTWLHGFPTSSLDWAGMVAAFPGWRHITLDFLGFGASEKPLPHEYLLMEQASLVEACWRAHGVTRTALVAHDYGVSVGQELLARRADGALEVELTAAAFLNGGLFPALHRPTPVQELMAGPEGPAFAAQITEEAFAFGLRGVLSAPVSDEELHEHWLAMARDDGHLRMPALLNYMAERRVHGDRWVGALVECDLPLRFVWGPEDPVSGGHVVPELQARLPHAPIHVLDGIGHYPQMEAPDRVAALLADLA